MNAFRKTAFQAAAALCVAVSGMALSIHADEAPQKEEAGREVVQPALDLSAASIPITLPDAGSDGEAFLVGHTVGDTDAKGWCAKVATSNPRSPGVDSGLVVVGNGGGSNIYGYDVLTGERKWTAASKDSGISDITIGLGRAYYTTHSCTIESVRIADGKQLYSKYIAPTVECGADYADGMLATSFNNAGWKVNLREAESGTSKWSVALKNNSVLTMPVIQDTGVYVTTADGNLTRLNVKGGKSDWSADIGAVSAPVATPWGLVVTTTWDGSSDGVPARQAGKKDADKRDRETVTGPDSTIPTVVASKDRRVALIEKTGSEPKGRVGNVDTGPRASLDFQGLRPGITEKHVIMAYRGRIACVDPVAGKAIWSLRLADNDGGFVKPVAHRGLVILAGTSGVVSAIEETTGALVWSYRFKGRQFVAAPAVDDERVFLTTTSGELLCLPTGAGNVDAGRPAAKRDDIERVAAAYWRVQDTFRKVRNILHEIESAKPEPEAPQAGDGTPAGNQGDGVNSRSEAIRPREDEE